MCRGSTTRDANGPGRRARHVPVGSAGTGTTTRRQLRCVPCSRGRLLTSQVSIGYVRTTTSGFSPDGSTRGRARALALALGAQRGGWCAAGGRRPARLIGAFYGGLRERERERERHDGKRRPRAALPAPPYRHQRKLPDRSIVSSLGRA